MESKMKTTFCCLLLVPVGMMFPQRVMSSVSMNVDDADALVTLDGIVFSKDTKTLVHVPPDKAVGMFEVPESVEVIYDKAFLGCRFMTALKIHKGVHSIVPQRGCDSLSAFVVDGDNPFLSSRDGVLYDKNATTLLGTPSVFHDAMLKLPDGLLRIPPAAFTKTRGLRVIRIPATLKEIGQWCFLGGGDLREFVVDEKNPRYKSVDGMLVDVSSKTLIRCPPKIVMSELMVPKGITNIGYCAFSNCANLSTIILSEGVRVLGDWAFSGCSGLKKIEMPASLEAISCTAFCGCGGLREISVSHGNRNYMALDGSLYYKRQELVRQSAAVVGGVVSIPDFVVGIASDAFDGLDVVRRIIVPPGVVRLGSMSLSGCRTLEDVVFMGDMPQGLILSCIPDECTVYADLNMRLWGKFSNALKKGGCIKWHLEDIRDLGAMLSK